MYRFSASNKRVHAAGRNELVASDLSIFKLSAAVKQIFEFLDYWVLMISYSEYFYYVLFRNARITRHIWTRRPLTSI